MKFQPALKQKLVLPPAVGDNGEGPLRDEFVM